MRLVMRVVVLTAAATMAACGGDPPAPPVQPSPTPAALVGMQIEGPPVRDIGAVGDTLQLRAIATLDDGTRPDVTAEATWTVTNPNVLAVSSRGLVSALANGSSIVDATYRGRAGSTNLTVRPEAGARYPLTGVVIDAETRQPVPGAFVSAPSTGADRTAFTDGNGFFDLGTAIRPVTLTATAFGFADAVQVVAEPRGPAHTTLGLTPNGPFIERRLDPDTVAMDGTDAVATWRISTRPNGVLDAMATWANCDYNDSIGLRAESGGVAFTATGFPCSPRLRIVPPASRVVVTARTRRPGAVRLVIREPR